MPNPISTDICIIGAGPVGLACALEAQRRGLRAAVVDKGALVNSIVGYPTNMEFFSTPELLEIGGYPFPTSHYKPLREDALDYYQRVARDEKLVLDHVLNYPNPFAGSTTFFFDHNQAGSVPGPLDVQVQIFTVAGRLVRTLTAVVPSTEAHQKSITWNGRDEYNDQLARGVYVYRLSVRSQGKGTTASKYEKLVILN